MVAPRAHAAQPASRSPGRVEFSRAAAVWTCARDEPGRESAATAGAGVGMNGARLNGHLEVAKPFTHPDVEGNRDTMLFAELSLRFPSRPAGDEPHQVKHGERERSSIAAEVHGVSGCARPCKRRRASATAGGTVAVTPFLFAQVKGAPV